MNVRRRRVPVCVLLTPTASTRRARTSVSVQLASRPSQINQPTATLSPAKVILLLYFTASFTLVGIYTVQLSMMSYCSLEATLKQYILTVIGNANIIYKKV